MNDFEIGGETPADVDHEIGDNNVQRFGLDVHNPVFAVSALLAIATVLGTLAFREPAAALFQSLREWTMAGFDWFFLLAVNLFLLFLVVLAVSPLGRIRLGGDDARPIYGYGGWLAMLFAAGVGIGLMFFGPLEPLTHTLTPPLGVDAGDVETARSVGMAAVIFHWGLHAWAIYGLVGLSLAFFCFNNNMPLTLRSAFFPVFGNMVWGPVGHAIDIVAVLATLFGLGVSLAYGAGQIAGGLNYLFDVTPDDTTKVLLILGIIGVALVSVVAGLDKGVKRLSEVNMSMAVVLWIFVIVAGPTAVVLAQIPETLIDYARWLPALSNFVGRDDTGFMRDWSVFYMAWWVSWSPFVGMFIARISYGRTVREFIGWVLVAPTVIAVLWMSVFGGTSLEQLFGQGYEGVANAVPELALFRMLELLPWAAMVSTVSVFLIAIFFITSADSGSLVMDIITAGGKIDAPLPQRVFWCLLSGLVAIALMLGGGMASLQALTISVGLPLTAILLIMCVGLVRGLRGEHARE